MNPSAISPDKPVSALTLSVFGGFDVRWHGQPIDRLAHGKLAALLAYLATEPGPHLRANLAALFWPDASRQAARLNLRQALFQLRNTLLAVTGRDFVVSSRHHHVGLAAEFRPALSLIDFTAPLPLCSSIESAKCAGCLEYLAVLANAYIGPFLAGVSLPDCLDFEEWLLCKREALHRHALDLLTRLADCHERRGDYRAALVFVLRYLALEPWSEAGQLRAIRLYAADAQYDAAFAQYDSFCRALERDLGVAPGADLQRYAAQIRAAVPRPLESLTMPEERRQITVLYGELHAINVVDPEDALAALSAPQILCAEIVRRHTGHIVRGYGGGLLAYFGYPQALENAALSGVRAARALAAESGGLFSVRVGVHSGLIVTSSGAKTPDAMGMTSDIAIRLCDLANAGDVVVSEETQRRSVGFFHFISIEQHLFRQQPIAQKAFKVAGETGARHRLTAADQLTPFIGRDPELAMLLRTWAQARRGVFRAVLLHGEPGIGKSRLADTLIRRLDNGPYIVRELRCFFETKHSPLQPVIALFTGLCGIRASDDQAARRAKLGELLHIHAPELVERGLPLLGQMMGFGPDVAPLASVTSPAQIKCAVRDLLIDLIYSLAKRNPVLLVAEDMHWADELTLDFLAVLVARRAPAPILLLLAARPEWRPGWPGLEIITVPPLHDDDVASLVDTLRVDIAPTQRARIVSLAEGVPLFAEELAARDGSLSAEGNDELPATLHDLLMARLDKLGLARAVAQLAATVGREFEMSFISTLSDLSPQSLAKAAGRLCDAGLWLVMPDGYFQFKHVLVQEAAYLSQTRAARKAAHRRIAQMLERHRADECRKPPEILARHWGAADEPVRALPLWLAAGKHAAERFAHSEAITHYEAGICLVPSMVTGTERDRLYFALLVGLAQSEQFVSGYGCTRSKKHLDDAIVLLERGTGNGVDFFRVIWGLWEGAGSRVNHREAVHLAQRLIEIAKVNRAPDLLLQGHYALGNSLFWTGQLMESRQHLETALAMIELDTQTPLRDCYGSIVVVGIEVYLSWVLWLQGDTKRALMFSDEALLLARRYGDAYSLAFALTFAATLRRWLGHVDEAKCLAQEGRAVAVSCESAVFETAMVMTCGWANVMQVDTSAIVFIEQGINAIRTAMSAVVVPLLALFADALLHLGDTTKALSVLEEALRESEATQDRHYLAELHRMRGLCLQASGKQREAKISFGLAIEVSKTQNAVVFGQRARRCHAWPGMTGRYKDDGA